MDYKKFSTKTEEEQEAIKLFKEVFTEEKKKLIAELFDVGVKVGFWKKDIIIPMTQFVWKGFVYQLRRFSLQQKPVNINLNKNIVGNQILQQRPHSKKELREMIQKRGVEPSKRF